MTKILKWLLCFLIVPLAFASGFFGIWGIGLLIVKHPYFIGIAAVIGIWIYLTCSFYEELF